jgi:hypothetical protein
MSNTNINDVLKQLDDLNRQTGINIFVPSLQRNLKFKPLNLRQQKNLLKSSIEETLTKLSFITNFYSILQENILDGFDISSLCVYDRPAIAIAMRAASLDSKFTIEDDTYDLNEKIREFTDIKPTIAPLTVEEQNFQILLEAPKLGLDRDISSSVLTKFRNSKTEDVKTIVGELFIHEIIKYIKEVTIKTNDGDSTLDFSALKLDVKISVAERFPTTITNKVLEFIKTCRDFESQYTKLDDENSIEIDGSFFAI